MFGYEFEVILFINSEIIGLREEDKSRKNKSTQVS